MESDNPVLSIYYHDMDMFLECYLCLNMAIGQNQPNFYNATLVVSAFNNSIDSVAVSADDSTGSSVFFGIVIVVRVKK